MSSSTTSTNRVEYPRAGNWDIGKGTVDLWTYFPTWNNANYYDLFGCSTTAAVGDREHVVWKRGNDNTLEVYFSSQTSSGQYVSWGYANGVSYTQATGQGGWVDAAWNHVAWTWDTTKGITIYINGFALSSTTTGPGDGGGDLGPSQVWNPNFVVGHGNTANGGWGGGVWPSNSFIDELRISNIDRYGGTNFTPPSSQYPLPSTGIRNWMLYDQKND